MDLVEKLYSLGPPGLICVVLIYALWKSEQRETKKDSRIQLLENQLIESYDERITAADRMSDALHGSARAMDSLTSEIRSSKHA